MSSFDSVFHAYDVRGTVPEQLDAAMCRAIGAAFARFAGSDKILVAHDMRPSGIELVAEFAQGARSQGTTVVDVGLASTDLLYFASGLLDAPGAMFTASHNPAQYNGIKFCLAGAKPVGSESGLVDIKEAAVKFADDPASTALSGRAGEGGTESVDLLDKFADHVVSFIDISQLRPLKVVADTANGMGGLIVPKVFERLPGIEIEIMYGELDGTFPNHPADPIQPANQRDLQARVVAAGADVGLAFDGDADRVFCVDEFGKGLSGSTTTALLAVGVLAKKPGSTILHNLICSKAVPEVVREHGGVPVRTRVGHSFIKQVMAETGAAFGGEHSAHYYFRDNYRADSGIIATMFVLEQMGITGQPLSELRKPLERYASSGEINTEVHDQAGVIARVAEAYASFEQDTIDGLTVDCGSWWFNQRPSNTEPLLRLNLEAAERDACDEHFAEVLALVTA
ncbi:MAG: phosphomannomutase/phosphoglucomutase [Acidimicrobiia bacterium]